MIREEKQYKDAYKLSDTEIIAECIEMVDSDDKTIINIIRYFRWNKRLTEKQKDLLILWMLRWKHENRMMFDGSFMKKKE